MKNPARIPDSWVTSENIATADPIANVRPQNGGLTVPVPQDNNVASSEKPAILVKLVPSGKEPIAVDKLRVTVSVVYPYHIDDHVKILE